MYKFFQGLAVTMALLLTLAATAQEKPLTDSRINQYIESLREMEQLSERIAAQDQEGAATMAQLWLKGDTAAITDYLKQQEYYPELEQAINEAGFDETKQWVNTAQRVTQAYMALELEGKEENVAQEMEQALQQVRQSEQFSEAQKQALIQQMQDTQAQLSKIEQVTQADREAVRPHLDELREQFESEPQTSAR